MPRLRQQYPQNYVASGNISAEFESVIRYLNAAELGNKTLAELMSQLFNADGNFDGPIEFRRDLAGSIDYRVGEFSDPSAGWTQLLQLEELRGEPGLALGTIGAPIFYGRVDYVAVASQTVFDYAHTSTDTILVYVNGVLKRDGASYDYTTSPTAGTGGAGAVTFNTAVATGATVTLFKVRSTAVTGFTRSDTITVATTATFAFAHDETAVIQVYKNGILQREGALYDYTKNAALDTITFNIPVPSGNLVTFITLINTSDQAITGLMMESTFCDVATGLINFAKLKIADGEIPASKVASLVALINSAASLSVSSTTPVPATDLWLDTSQSPNQLKFWDGTQYLRTNTASSVPSFTAANASQTLRVNGTGTGLEFANVDLSSVIPLTQRGAANGVATLDTTGRLNTTQLPLDIATVGYFWAPSGALANGTYLVNRIFKQRVTISAISARLASGTCTVQIAVNGVALGTTYNLSSTPTEVTLPTPIEIDATTASRAIQLIVTAGAAPTSPEVTLAGSIQT